MPTPEADIRRQHLRTATASAHAHLDGLFPDGLADAATYGGYVRGMHRLCADIQAGWHALPPGTAVDEAVDRRVCLLETDLARLGLPVLPPGPALALSGPLELAGAEYVVQGSRMGAKLLVRQARLLGYGEPGSGADFLHWHVRPEGLAEWNALLERIAVLVRNAKDEDTLMAAAIRTFTAAAFAFERASHGQATR